MPKSDYQRGVRDQYYDRPPTIDDLLNPDYERGRSRIVLVSQESNDLSGLIEIGFLLLGLLLKPILHTIIVCFFSLLTIYALLSQQFPLAAGALPTAITSGILSAILIWLAFRHYPIRFSILVLLLVGMIGIELYANYRQGNLNFAEVMAIGDNSMTAIVQAFIGLWNDTILPSIKQLLQQLNLG